MSNLAHPSKRSNSVVRNLTTFLLAVTAAVAISACSVSTSSTSSSSPQTTVGPSSPYFSPASVVRDDFSDDLTGQVLAACQLLQLQYQATCESAASGPIPGVVPTTVVSPSGSATVGRTVISGREALVAVTGLVCREGCQDNTNPNAGMPDSTLGFAAAYRQALSDGDLSPVPCVLVDGAWYLAYSHP